MRYAFTLVELPAMSKRGFTLVELLVVITIIVLLLALLMPAMSKAVYQAQLTGCAAKLKATAAAITHYTFDSKRRYPDRAITSRDPATEAGFLQPFKLASPPVLYDMRPALAPVLDVTRMLQCPFSDVGLDFVNTEPDVSVETSYVMFWGWGYHTAAGREQAMLRMGDRFSWGSRSYNVLAGDLDIRYTTANYIGASHPDFEPNAMSLAFLDDGFSFGFRIRVSRWNIISRNRGEIDLNFSHDDGSVRRTLGVPGWDKKHPAMDRVPMNYDDHRPSDYMELPGGQ